MDAPAVTGEAQTAPTGAPTHDFDAAALRDPWSPSAAASSWLGVIGLVVALFLPWGALACFAAVVLGIAARPGDAAGRVRRIIGILTGIAGILFAAAWIVVAVRHADLS